MDKPIVVASTRSRIVVIAKFFLGLAFAVGLLQQGPRLFRDHVSPLPICEQLPWIGLALVVYMAVPAAYGLVLARDARRVWQAGQSPAPGTAVFFTRRVETGWRARLTAMGLFAIATSLFAFACGLLYWFISSGLWAWVLGHRSCAA